MTRQRWSLRGSLRVLGSLVVLMAVGDLLLEQEAVGSRKSVLMTDAAPTAKLAFQMENVVLPSPPPRTAPERIETSGHAEAPVSARPIETMRAAAAPEPGELGPLDRTDALPREAADPVRVDRAEGERLLRRAERGELELARIAWPESPDERARLDAWLHDCIGVRNALLSGRTLVAAEPDVGANASRRFSGLVRRIEGIPAPAEARRLARLRAGGGTGAAIRLFPRDFDAVLLGVLSSMGVPGADARVRYRFRERLSLEVNGGIVEIPVGLDSGCRS